jgi:hypothetical protein
VKKNGLHRGVISLIEGLASLVDEKARGGVRTVPFLLALCVGGWTSAVAVEQPPTGWTEEQRVEGDLDDNGRADRVLVLVGAEGEVSDERALLVQLADGDGGFRTLAFAPGVLPCVSCMGLLGGTGPESYEVDIEDGKLLLWWSRGSREMVEASLTFAYDAERQSMRLVQDEVIATDRALGNEQVVARDWLDEGAALPYREIREVSADDY